MTVLEAVSLLVWPHAVAVGALTAAVRGLVALRRRRRAAREEAAWAVYVDRQDIDAHLALWEAELQEDRT